MNDSTAREKLYRVFDGKGPVTGTDRMWALSMAGVTQSELADELGITQAVISRVLRDDATSYNVAAALAEVTGLTLNRLWPCGKYAVAPAERKRAAAKLKEAA